MIRTNKGFILSKRLARLRVVPIKPVQKRIPAGIPFVSIQGSSRLRFITLAVLVCAMAGCGNATIIGKWRMLGGSDATVWEFSKNGSVLIGNVRGRYTFGNQSRIKIETPFATSVYRMEISGGRLILREPGGPKLEFTRIRETQD